MPLACDPNETLLICLKTDEDKPEADRPVFRFHYLTVREWREHSWLADDQKRLEAMKMEELLDALADAVRVNLIGWDRMPSRDGAGTPYDPARLAEMLTVEELWELFFKARRQSRLDPEAKKNSNSDSPSDTDEPAPDHVQDEGFPARTSPAPGSPSS